MICVCIHKHHLLLLGSLAILQHDVLAWTLLLMQAATIVPKILNLTFFQVIDDYENSPFQSGLCPWREDVFNMINSIVCYQCQTVHVQGLSTGNCYQALPIARMTVNSDDDHQKNQTLLQQTASGIHGTVMEKLEKGAQLTYWLS